MFSPVRALVGIVALTSLVRIRRSRLAIHD